MRDDYIGKAEITLDEYINKAYPPTITLQLTNKKGKNNGKVHISVEFTLKPLSIEEEREKTLMEEK